MTTAQPTASDVYEALARGDHFAREAAQQGLGGLDESVRAELRGLLIEGLDEFAPDRKKDERYQDRPWVRSWLVSSLARLADDDEAFQVVERYVAHSDVEWFEWVRYWALAGLVAAGHPRCADVAQVVADRDKERPLLWWLATAILAEHDETCRARIDEKLLDGKKQFSEETYWVLRALRIAPLPGTEEGIAAVIRRPGGVYDSATYQAVVALGAVKNGDSHKKTAALELLALVEQKAGELMWSEARARALEGLGRLGYEPSASTLVDALGDGSPTIVQQAAMALERLLEPALAVDRVVERVQARPELLRNAATGLRYMRDQEGIADRLMQILMSAQPEQEAVARDLLTEMGGASAYSKLGVRARSVERYQKVLDEAERRVRELFESSIEEARHGFMLGTRMDVALFILGWVLILVSAVIALLNDGSLAAWAGGTTGVAAVLHSVFIATPRKNVPEEVRHLMFMKVVFLGYLRQLHQVDQAFSRRMLSPSEDALGHAEVAEFRGLVKDAMEDAVQDIHDAQDRGKRPRKRRRRGATTPPVNPG